MQLEVICLTMFSKIESCILYWQMGLKSIKQDLKYNDVKDLFPQVVEFVDPHHNNPSYGTAWYCADIHGNFSLLKENWEKN